MKKIIIISSILGTILAIWLGLYIYKWEYRKPLFEVHFFSLKRGRSIFMRTPENKTILIGAGQNSEVIREITKVTPFYSRKIDYVLVPSATPEQIGGILEILDRYEVGEIIKPKIMATSTVLSQLARKIGQKKIHVEEVLMGDSFYIGSLKADTLFPLEDFKYNKSSLPELALVFSYKNSSVYLIGKLSKTIQKTISKNISESLNTNLRENIAEVYGSGIESKVSQDLFEKLKPKYTFTTKEKSTRWVSDGNGWRD